LLPAQLLDPPDADGADVDDLDLGVEAVAVLALVRAMESLSQLLDPSVADCAGRNVEAHLVALARVAAVGEPVDQPPVLRHAIRLELCGRLCAELVETRRQPLAVERAQRVA